MDELVAGLAELREIGDHRLIRLDHLAATAEATATGPATLRSVLRLWRERHGEIGANARKGISTFAWASSSPRERDDTAMTSETPTARPRP